MKNEIWLSSPHMGGQEMDFIKDAFAKNWVAPLGENVTGFENDLQKFLGNKVEVATLCTGTAALHLALIQAGVTWGDEVICQSLTFSASANPIVYQGATPVFVDSERDTWNMDPQTLEDAIKDRIAKGKKPKAIMAVHLYGMPCKIDQIKTTAEKYGITLIEDAAEALGSTFKGRPCGTFGHFGALSFNGNKVITTSGGGALISHSVDDKAMTIFLSTQARDKAPHYQHSHIGYNYRLSNICAGIGRGQMKVLPARVEARRAMFHFYCQLFKNIRGVKVLAEPDTNFFSNHWLTTIHIDPNLTGGITREDLRLALDKENIESRPIWKPMHLQPVFEDSPYYDNGNVAEDLFDNGLCLPSGSNLTDEERSRIAAAIISFFNRDGSAINEKFVSKASRNLA